MKKLIFLLLISNLCLAQERGKFSFDTKFSTFSGLGNNFLHDGVNTFAGLGLGLSYKAYKNFGLGIDYTVGSTQVKDVSVFGSLKNPKISAFDFYFFYLYPVTNRLNAEANLGFGDMRIKSDSDYRTEGFREGGDSYLIGGKLYYDITPKKDLSAFFATRLYFYNSDVKMNNPQIEKYYSNATLLNFSLGLKLFF